MLEHGCTGGGTGGFDAEGEFPPPEDWPRTAQVVAGVGFENLSGSSHPRTAFKRRSDGYRAWAFGVIVPAGKSATIKMASARAAFLRDPGSGDGNPRYQLAEGVLKLHLTACSEEDTRFLEAIIVGGAQCTNVMVGLDSERGRMVAIPFASRCD